MVGVEIQGPPGEDQGGVVLAAPRGQVGQAGQRVGRTGLDLDGPTECRLGAGEVISPGEHPGLEDQQVGVGRVAAEELFEQGLRLVPAARIAIGAGQQELDLGVSRIGLERVEGQCDGLVVGPGVEGPPDLVLALGPCPGRQHEAEREEGGRPDDATDVLAHDVCPALAKPFFSMAPQSALPLR